MMKNMNKMKKCFLLVVVIFLISACSRQSGEIVTEPTQIEKEKETPVKQIGIDNTYENSDGMDVIYLAGGCFWGLEKLMQSIPGVVDVVSGYANGSSEVVPTYDRVIQGDTGYRETVRVEYDPSAISLDALLFAYFHVIDPTIENAQGNDRGTQYQTGVYYVDEDSQATVERIAAIESERSDVFVVEIEPLERFYDAEEYHQDYLDKNPRGYCHISQNEMQAASEMIVDPGDYPRPSDAEIKEMLTDIQYEVTQLAGTEYPFTSELYENQAPGIYVDVVTGEPLFSSSDKFESGTGWPSFTAPIDENAVRLIEDNSLGMRRTEVRSRAGNSHLGHVFYNDSSSPNGVRYCINGAALRFVSREAMESEGYGYLLGYVE
jgi:peptide methionine sulfoxide reductase msrA/msrB